MGPTGRGKQGLGAAVTHSAAHSLSLCALWHHRGLCFPRPGLFLLSLLQRERVWKVPEESEKLGVGPGLVFVRSKVLNCRVCCDDAGQQNYHLLPTPHVISEVEGEQVSLRRDASWVESDAGRLWSHSRQCLAESVQGGTGRSTGGHCLRLRPDCWISVL